jgi:hypothetical protein
LNLESSHWTRIIILFRVPRDLAATLDALVCRRSLAVAMLVLWFLSSAAPLQSREHKKKKEDYGLGFSTEISAPESEVLEVVQTVINNGIIQGSKEYNKDQYIEGASAAESSTLFPAWTGPGKVFFKVRTGALDPRGFYESNDMGTLAVRYVVQSKDASNTILRIDAVFVEDFRHIVHPSDGSVENAEYKDIQDHVDTIELQKKQAEEAGKHREEEIAKLALEQKSEQAEATALALAQSSAETLEQHVQNLRHQVERVIKAPGAELKAAPFRTAAKLKTLDTGSAVVILIATPYWFGVETEDGQHGWINHAQLEPLP